MSRRGQFPGPRAGHLCRRVHEALAIAVALRYHQRPWLLAARTPAAVQTKGPFGVRYRNLGNTDRKIAGK